MLGAVKNDVMGEADRVTQEIARELGREEHFEKTRVSIFFGEPGKKVPDPFFDGKGPDRVGCTQCGSCMTGCRVGAKNTLDQNYLYLAEQGGCRILPETEVLAVRERAGGGYRVETKCSTADRGERVFEADNVVFSGGVMGTVPLLLKMKEDPRGLPRLSDRVGDFVRTNSESLIGVTSEREDVDFSRGIAIASIVHTDEHSHFEPVRYGPGSSFFQPLMMPHAPGRSVVTRVVKTAGLVAKHWRKVRFARSTKRYSELGTIMLYMRTLDGTLRLRFGRSALNGFRRGLVTQLDESGVAPKAFMKEATDIAWRFAKKVKGIPTTLFTETLLGSASTAHILGGACMGATAADGVIDHQHRVHGYPGLYVVDGAAVSANPGVNPSLTITALAERAMGFVPEKAARGADAAE